MTAAQLFKLLNSIEIFIGAEVGWDTLKVGSVGTDKYGNVTSIALGKEKDMGKWRN